MRRRGRACEARAIVHILQCERYPSYRLASFGIDHGPGQDQRHGGRVTR